MDASEPASPSSRAPERLAVDLVVPGSLDTRTGGYGYDRRIVAALRDDGHDVRVHELAGDYPWPDEAARADAVRAFASIGDGRRVIVDGLACGALPTLVRDEAARLRLLALVHHPLAAESALSAEAAVALQDSERRALAAVAGAITTSGATAEALRDDYGMSARRLRTVPPGTDAAPAAHGSASGTTNLLCVATLTARKGHVTLLDALARLERRDWRLRCVGSATRDPATADALVERIAALGLDDGRVTLDGEADEATLAARYAEADLFVLATRYEGYGMVFDEALARALPIVASGAGAVADTVPDDAGLLVPPDDVTALHEALSRWFDDAALRERLRRGAREARGRLRSWETAGRAFAVAIDALSATPSPRERAR